MDPSEWTESIVHSHGHEIRKTSHNERLASCPNNSPPNDVIKTVYWSLDQDRRPIIAAPLQCTPLAALLYYHERLAAAQYNGRSTMRQCQPGNGHAVG